MSFKKITQSSPTSENTPIQLMDFKEIMFLKEIPLSYSFKSISKNVNTLFTYNNKYSYLNVDLIFHPPKAELYFIG
jgi:hypothetical protein